MWHSHDARCFRWGCACAAGDLDIYLSQQYAPDLLFRNVEFGTSFIAVSTSFAASLQNSYPTVANAWADVDGDGDFDALLCPNTQNGENTCQLYVNDGGGSYVAVPADSATCSISVVLESWPGAAVVGDLDGDGDEDVLYVNPPHTVHRNDGGGAFTRVDAGALARDACGADEGSGCTEYPYDSYPYDKQGSPVYIGGRSAAFGDCARTRTHRAWLSYSRARVRVGSVTVPVRVHVACGLAVDGDGDLDVVFGGVSLVGDDVNTLMNTHAYYRVSRRTTDRAHTRATPYDARTLA